MCLAHAWLLQLELGRFMRKCHCLPCKTCEICTETVTSAVTCGSIVTLSQSCWYCNQYAASGARCCVDVASVYVVLQEPGSNLVLRQSGHIKSGERVHIYSADMRRTVSLQFYPDSYELVEPQPVLISQGYSSSQAGVQGRQKLPEVFRVQRSGGEPQEIFLDRDIDMEAWQMNDKVSGGATGASVHALYLLQ